MDAASRLERYHAAVRATDALIETAYAPAGTSRADITARAAYRMARVRSLLTDLGDPFGRIPIVHIGGTSGKGSTSAFLSAILTAAGYQTGLHTSPYLQVATEKLQLNGHLVAPERFAEIAFHVLDVAHAWSERQGERLTYGEIWLGIIACFFRDEGADIGVLEVGAGGRFDLTNVITPALSVITSIGLDHIQTLGDTIEAIAWHKAGIIKPGIPAVTAVDDPRALPVIRDEATERKSELTQIVAGRDFAIDRADASGVEWRELPDGRGFKTSMPGRFQGANAATAVAAARALQRQGFAISESAIKTGVRQARIPGRAEYMQQHPLVLLDGAHNPQKVGALAADLANLLPVKPGGRRIAVLGMLDAKAHVEALDALRPAIDALVITSPHVLAKAGMAAERLAAVARERGFADPIVEPEPLDALAAALAMASPADAIVVTGSLYLVGNIRGHWQPDDEIVLKQTAWPRPIESFIG